MSTASAENDSTNEEAHRCPSRRHRWVAFERARCLNVVSLGTAARRSRAPRHLSSTQVAVAKCLVKRCESDRCNHAATGASSAAACSNRIRTAPQAHICADSTRGVEP
jgi:hypothetical protein